MSDNQRLSAPLARSDEELAEAVVRMVRALGRRAEMGDPDVARLFRLVGEEVDSALARAVSGWRAAGYSDADIGRELGVTKQAIAKRWPRQPGVVA